MSSACAHSRIHRKHVHWVLTPSSYGLLGLRSGDWSHRRFVKRCIRTTFRNGNNSSALLRDESVPRPSKTKGSQLSRAFLFPSVLAFVFPIPYSLLPLPCPTIPLPAVRGSHRAQQCHTSAAYVSHPACAVVGLHRRRVPRESCAMCRLA